MPPKNVAAPNAVKLFHCKICDKGYPRQTEYENHLRSYDHNHRQRLADMKKITAANDSDNTRSSKRGLDEMRSIPMEGAGLRPGMGLGKGFKRVGVDTSKGGASGGFKKVGVTVGAPSGFKKVGVETSSGAGGPVSVTKSGSEPMPIPTPVEPAKVDNSPSEEEIKTVVEIAGTEEAETKLQRDEDAEDKDGEDIVMGEDNDDSEDDTYSWDEYDFRKPTGCDHASCLGCKAAGVVEDGWVFVGAV
ncbi:hypothetical protein K504DRAFT_480349 [Pleomassaria siparia CBS 279.74]|uniref:C2H2-type domain-containing protein n=1 Tax=Pleomassaria siparia CBS 279.74 TaxID=1314801 RepID=A0A6G1KK83_9PLEO|nr:hypothetical protein K504DRAFT_480349 [Pleomassaria siparia CBS 279.74]